MTSKDLVPVHSRELARIESPCPVFDAEVKSLVVQIWESEMDRELFPEERRNSRAHFQTQLRKAVERLEGPEGEQAPEPVRTQPEPSELPPDGEATTLLPKSVLSMSDEQFERMWNELRLDLHEKLARANEETDR